MIGAVIILGETPLLGLYSGKNIISLDYLNRNNVAGDLLTKATGVLQNNGLKSIKVVVESQLIAGATPDNIDGHVIDVIDTDNGSYLAAVSSEDIGLLKDIKRMFILDGDIGGKLEVFDKMKLVSSRVKESCVILGETDGNTILSVADSKGIVAMSMLAKGQEVENGVSLLQDFYASAPIYTTSTFVTPNYYPSHFVNIKELLDNPDVSPFLKNALFLMDLCSMLPGREIATINVAEPRQQGFGVVPPTGYSADISEDVFETTNDVVHEDTDKSGGLFGFLKGGKPKKSRR